MVSLLLQDNKADKLISNQLITRYNISLPRNHTVYVIDVL